MVKLLRPVFGRIRLLDVLLAAASFLLSWLMLVGGSALELLPGLTASERAILTARLPWLAALMALQGLLLVWWHARPWHTFSGYAITQLTRAALFTMPVGQGPVPCWCSTRWAPGCGRDGHWPSPLPWPPSRPSSRWRRHSR